MLLLIVDYNFYIAAVFVPRKIWDKFLYTPLCSYHWHHCPTPASPLSDDSLFGRGNERKPTLSKPTLSTSQRNGKASSPQTINHRGTATRATAARVGARGREHPNGGPCHHLSSCQGSSSLHQPRGVPNQSHCGHDPKHATTTLRRLGG
jgi:hypothetical protein